MDNSLFNFQASHLMLSTNPKLTTNVRIMVDSTDNIFLESFDANLELSQYKFKKFRVKPNSSYNKDLYKFYSFGKFPKQFAYEVFKADSNLKILNDFSKQYDNFYKYGAYRLKSKLYEEEASIFAPLWLNDYVPKYFIIFKANSPYYNDFTEDILHKSTIIKTIDLRETSNIGKYIRNYQKTIPAAPITFSPENAEMTYFNGIDYNTGTIISKGNFVYPEYIQKDKTIIEYDNFMTKGFENNGMIVANLLNLEFLFTDETTDNYDINRYFGLYVDEIPDGTFEIDIDTMYQKKHVDRYQTITPSLITGSKKVFKLDGLDGTTIYAKNVESDIGYYNYDDIKNLNSFFYTKDLFENFYMINTKSRWSENEVKLSNNQLDLNKFLDNQKSISFIDIDRVSSYGRSHVIFEILNDIPSSFGIKFYDGNDLFLEVYSDENLTLLDQNDYDFYFISSHPKKKKIAASIAKAINNMGKNKIEAFSVDNKVVVNSIFQGTKFNGLRFEFETRSLTYQAFIKDSSNNGYFVGGSNPTDNRFIFHDSFTEQFENKYVLTEDNDLEKASLGFYIDDVERINDYRTAIIKKNPKFSNGQMMLIDKPITEFGRFNIYPVKDFDVDFYSYEYTRDSELMFEKDHYENYTATPTDISNLYEENNFYELSNNEINEYDVNKENYNLDFATASKIVPYINKWVYKNGKNIKEYDYRLNAAKALGIYNRTPAKLDKTQSVDSYTHGWYYLKNIPDYYLGNEEVIKSYIKTDLTVDDFLSVTDDNFLNVFSYNYINDKVLDSNKFKFSIFQDGNSIDFSESFFKGIKVRAKERIEDDNIIVNYNIDSLKFKTDYEKFNDYKFSVILINDQNFFDSNYKIKVIKNEKFKFIVLTITVNIDFTEVLDKTLLYSLKNKYNDSAEFSDVKLRGTIDLESILYNSDYYTIKGTFDKENIFTEFVKQIKVNPEGKFFQIHFDYKNSYYEITDVFRVLTNDTLYARNFTVTEGSVTTPLFSFPMIYPSKRDMSYLNYDPINSENGLIVKKGGFNFYKDLMDSISFANIYSDINEGNPNVEYITVLEDGGLKTDDFILELITPNLIAMPMYIENTADRDKPINFNFINIIGYRLKLKDVEVAPFYKHTGSFVPKFKNIFEFIDPYVLDSTIDETYKSTVLDNVKYLNTNISKVSNLENKFYHKVTNKDYRILELESNENYNSVYPLIDECAFDFRNLDIFKTNWADDYYLNYLEKNVFENNPLKSGLDTKNYFGSKYMKTPFDVKLETGVDYTYTDNNTEITITFDIKNALQEFFYNKITLVEESEKNDFIEKNLLNLYETIKVDLYVLTRANGGAVDFSYMNTENVFKENDGLVVDTNYEVININNLDVTVVFRKIQGLSYSFGLSVDISLI
jgi:hypothetical protein